MPPVTELRDGRLGDALDPDHLASDRLQSTLGTRERPQFVLASKRGSVEIERDTGTESHSAARGYRTVTVVTDLRVLVAVGGAEGGDDRVESVPLATVDDIDTESGFLGGSLRLETAAGATWVLPCKGDLTEVVEYLQTATRAWSRGERIAAEVDDHLDAANDHLDAGAPEAALSATSEAESLIERGRDRLAAFDIGEAVAANAGLDQRRRAVRAIRRRAHAAAGDDAREQAHRHWQAEQYDRALSCYEAASAAYERARAFDAPRPDDGALADRIDGVDAAQSALAGVPRAEAIAACDHARDCADPVERAERFETALARHRDLLEHCWGPDAAFEGDTDAVRERIVDIVESLSDARIAAARRSLTTADRLDARGEKSAALDACDAAETHLREARTVAAEILPSEVAVLDAWLDGVEEQRDRLTADPATAEPNETDDPTPGEDGPDTVALAPDEVAETTSEDDRDGPAEDPDVTAALRALDRKAFTRLVAAVWGALGWETTVFAASVDQYDVLARRDWPVELRVLVWTVHTPGETVRTGAVDRCAADRANVDDADVAVLVTTGEVSEAVRERTREHNVKLLTAADLADVVERESLHGLLEPGGE